MEKLGIIEWAIIGFIIFAKFAIIIGVALWSRSNNKKKQQLLLQQQEAMKRAAEQSANL